jgi:class III poly(R)-hydroxyalkanoic acid synthase PhaE subunit
MSQKQDDTNASNEFFELQQKLWKDWSNAATTGMQSMMNQEKKPSANDPFAAMQEYWSGLATPNNSPAEAGQILQRMMQASKVYFDMAEQAKEGADIQQLATGWAERARETFAPFAAMADSDNAAFKDFRSFWDSPQNGWQNNWQNIFSSPFPLSGNVMGALNPEGINGMLGNIDGQLDNFLSTPALGYKRESQEKYQKLSRLMLDYQKSSYEYMTALAKVNMEAITVFQRKLQETTAAQEPVNSIKAVYDLWVDASEEVYAEFAMSDNYADIYGKLVNSLMSVKHQMTDILDDQLESLNMPTRREIDTLHKRLQSVRRDYNTLTSDRIESLEDDLTAMKAEIAGLKKSQGGGTTGKSDTKTTTTPPQASNAPSQKKK